MTADISSDVDSEAPTDTKIRVGVSRKKSQLRGWRRRYPVTSIRRRRRQLRNKSACLRRSCDWEEDSGVRTCHQTGRMTSIRRRRRWRRNKSACLQSQLRGWRAEISSDVDSEAPTDTKIRVGVSRKKSQLRGWRRRYPVTSIRRRRQRRRYKSAYLARSCNWEEDSGVRTCHHNRNFESPFSDDMATQP